MSKATLPGSAIGVVLKTGSALIGGSVAYSLWLGLFLILSNAQAELARIILWLLAPAITAGGFAGAAVGFDRLNRKQGRNPWKVYASSVTACALGAVLVYWLGPMLIVFGMLAAGTLAIFVLELATTFGGK